MSKSPKGRARPTQAGSNSIFTIYPYKKGVWKFDDARVQLKGEPFVGDVNDVIDKMTQRIPGAEQGFTLIFAPHRFPGWQVRMVRQDEKPISALVPSIYLPSIYAANGVELEPAQCGNTYLCVEAMVKDVIGTECWFCPALFCYFPEAPAELFGAAVALG